MDKLGFQMGLAVLGAFIFFQLMKRVKRCSRREDVLEDEHWL
jgi:hypothetical protein